MDKNIFLRHSSFALSERGVALLEVMVSLFILVNILFFINSLQITTLKILKSSLYAQIASNDLQNLNQRLKAANGLHSDFIIANWMHSASSILPNRLTKVIQRHGERIFMESWGAEVECKSYQIGLSGCLSLTGN